MSGFVIAKVAEGFESVVEKDNKPMAELDEVNP
jgi:hypothetical protein